MHLPRYSVYRSSSSLHLAHQVVAQQTYSDGQRRRGCRITAPSCETYTAPMSGLAVRIASFLFIHPSSYSNQSSGFDPTTCASTQNGISKPSAFRFIVSSRPSAPAGCAAGGRRCSRKPPAGRNCGTKPAQAPRFAASTKQKYAIHAIRSKSVAAVRPSVLPIHGDRSY